MRGCFSIVVPILLVLLPAGSRAKSWEGAQGASWEGFRRVSLARTSEKQGPATSSEGALLASAQDDFIHVHPTSSTFAKLKRGNTIRVQRMEGRILEGPFLEARADRLAFDDVDDTVIPYEEITHVWIWQSSRPRAMRKSAIFGSVVGAFIFGVNAYVHRETGFCWWGPCPKLEGRDQIFFVFATTTIGAGFGAALGALFGAAVAWEHVWEPLPFVDLPHAEGSHWSAPRPESP